jgi:protein SCO1/2
MTSPRKYNLIERLAGSPWFWLVWVVAIASFPIIRAVRSEVPEPLPVYRDLPDFEFQDQYGDAFGSERLRGKVWVANFIFTRCTTVCPIFTGEMYEIQNRSKQLADAIHLVSFTVDPEYDSPEVLLAYAQNHRVSPRMWSFLTGDLDQIRTTVVDGFKSAMGDANVVKADPSALFHGSHFVLVDSVGRIRGYYQSREEGVLDKLLGDINILVNVPGVGELPENYTRMDPATL